MKTSELQGAALDWAVWSALGLPATYLDHNGHAANFSTQWAQGGPIIERERIELIHYGTDGRKGCPWEAQIGCDTHYIDQSSGDAMGGPTPLVAAMRCYVTLKLGDEVDLPEGLK